MVNQSFKREEEKAEEEREHIVENLQRVEKYLAMLYASPGNPFLDKEEEKDQMYIKGIGEAKQYEAKQEEQPTYAQPIKIEPPKPAIESRGDTKFSQPVKTATKSLEEKYNIIYINPELGKPEIIKTTNYITFQSLEQKVVEEALAERNTNKILHYALERIVKEAQKPKIEVNAIALSKTLRNRDRLIVEIEKERKKIRETIKELENTKEKKPERLIKKLIKLPPLTRKRIEALLRKKKDKELILKLLLAEDFFLGKLKDLLTSLTIDKVKAIISAIRKVIHK